MVSRTRADKRNAADRGQELVEFALTSMVFFLLVIVLFDMGRVTYFSSVLHNAAREGARYGIINPNDSAAIEAVVRGRVIGIPPADVTITVTQPDVDHIRVNATWTMPIWTPIVASFFGAGGVPLGSQATMWIED